MPQNHCQRWEYSLWQFTSITWLTLPCLVYSALKGFCNSSAETALKQLPVRCFCRSKHCKLTFFLFLYADGWNRSMFDSSHLFYHLFLSNPIIIIGFAGYLLLLLIQSANHPILQYYLDRTFRLLTHVVIYTSGAPAFSLYRVD